MMKVAGYCMIGSLTPLSLHCVKTHNYCRFLSSQVFKKSYISKGARHSCKIRCLSTAPSMVVQDYRPPHFSVAPMMDWTTNHYRTLARLISKHAWLYTEMIAAETIMMLINYPNFADGVQDRFLEFSPEQHPIVLQIGCSNLENIAKATKLANAYGYDEINFKLFVGEAMSVIAANTGVPVTVKCRTGVDDRDFIYKVSSSSPVKHFIIHSRKALLNGISPAENRSIPPLNLNACKSQNFPHTAVEGIPGRGNGNGDDILPSPFFCSQPVNAARSAGAHGAMLGRAAFYNPWQTLGLVDSLVYGDAPTGITRRKVLEEFQVYGDSVLGIHGNNRPNIRDVFKPVLNLFHSEPGNAIWKRNVDAAFHECGTVQSLLEETLGAIPDWVLDSPVVKPIPGREDLFSNVHNLMPPSYTVREPKLSYA
ncbi:tRNA-dihydrouridine(20/20a) synthase-like protein [Drosera capensis]